jgi:Na+/H+ antiporter NhaC
MKLVTAYLLVVLAIIVVVWACINVVERQQTISAANQKFEQMIESAKELPPRFMREISHPAGPAPSRL